MTNLWASYLDFDEITTPVNYGLVVAGDWYMIEPRYVKNIDPRQIGGWFGNTHIVAELSAITAEFWKGLDWHDSSFVTGIFASDTCTDIDTVKRYLTVIPALQNEHDREGVESITQDGGFVTFVTLYDDGHRQAIRRGSGQYEPLLWISDYRLYPEVPYDPAIMRIDFGSDLFQGDLDDYLEGRFDHEVYVDHNGHFEKELHGRSFYRLNADHFSRNKSALDQWKAKYG